MPNWTENYLTIKVPSQHLDALLADLEGHTDWAAPYDGDRFFHKPTETSAHTQMAWTAILEGTTADAIAARQSLIAAFRAEVVATENRPDWMPIARHELREFWLRQQGLTEPQNPRPTTVPFSVAKLAPWKDRAEFDAIFPGHTDDQGFWSQNPSDQSAYNRGVRGYIQLRQDRLGVKWPPSEVQIHDHARHDDATTLVLISYNTPWSPISNLPSLLSDTLTKYGASAILVWKEEDQHSGWVYMDPDSNTIAEDSFEHGSHRRLVDDPDYPDEEYTEWDDESLLNAINETLEDTFGVELDFDPRLS